MTTVLTPRDAERFTGGSPAGPDRRDVILVIALIFATAVEAWLRADLSWRVATAIVTIAALSTLPWRRTHPLLVVAVTTALAAGFEIVQVLRGIPTGGLLTMFAILAAPYALFRWGSVRERTVGGAILVAGLVCSVILGGTNLSVPDGIAGAVAGVAFVGGAALIGALRRERVASRVREIAAIRAQERESLARDLHDTVAHHASAIVIRAQVARATPDDDARVAESLEVIEREASAVMDDMRSLVGVLRAPAGFAPSPGRDEILALAAEGPPAITVRIDGVGELPGVVSTTLFRIAQEGVTNARRHAQGATSIEVTLTQETGEARLVIIDDGQARGPVATGGHGLRGMSERAALLGGAIDAGPREAGGWMLRAVIPLRSIR